MCGVEALPKLLIWLFLGCAIVLAIVSMKLNEHLLVIPPQPTGPFSILFRRKYHVKPSFFLDPEKHFDATGQAWAKTFVRVLVVGVAVLIALVLVMQGCGHTIGTTATTG